MTITEAAPVRPDGGRSPRIQPGGAGAGRRIALAALLITCGNVVSRLLGLVRDQTIAALFGVTAGASIYSAASRVPTMVYDLLIGGAMTAALVPVFAEYAARDERRRESDPAHPELAPLVGAVLGLALAVLIPSVALLILFARPLMRLMGVGFEPAVQEQGVLLVRLALPSVVLLGASAVLMGALYALHRVALPSFSAAVYNVGIIVCALALAPWLGVASLVIGMLAGAAGQLLLQVPGLRGLRIRPRLDLRHPGVRRILGLYAPVAAGLLVSALVVTLDTRLASATGEGSLAAMRYATTLVQFPLGLVATALSFAVLPVLARYGAGGARATGYQQTLSAGIRVALLLIVPMMVTLMALGLPIVRLLFQRGAFTDEGARLTSLALLVYAPQLPFVAADQLLIAAFYALQNTLVPVLVGVAGAALYTAVALGTVGSLGMAGLVLANTVQNSAHAIVLMALLWRAAGGEWCRGLGAAIGRIALAGGAMAAILVGMQHVVAPPQPVLGLGAYLAGMIAISGAVYLAVLAVLGSEELGFARDLVARRLRRSAGGPP